MLPIICIALVLRLTHATGEAHVLIWTCWGLWQWLVAKWTEFQYSVVYYETDQCQKDWKHVSTQKVITLNTCCDTACLTVQLPHNHHNRFFSQPPTTTHNWLSSEPPTFERMQHIFRQMKKFCNSQVSVVTFSGGVGKWITVCFLLI